jgi:hypothetical protein
VNKPKVKRAIVAFAIGEDGEIFCCNNSTYKTWSGAIRNTPWCNRSKIIHETEISKVFECTDTYVVLIDIQHLIEQQLSLETVVGKLVAVAQVMRS